MEFQAAFDDDEGTAKRPFGQYFIGEDRVPARVNIRIIEWDCVVGYASSDVAVGSAVVEATNYTTLSAPFSALLTVRTRRAAPWVVVERER